MYFWINILLLTSKDAFPSSFKQPGEEPRVHLSVYFEKETELWNQLIKHWVSMLPYLVFTLHYSSETTILNFMFFNLLCVSKIYTYVSTNNIYYFLCFKTLYKWNYFLCIIRQLMYFFCCSPWFLRFVHVASCTCFVVIGFYHCVVWPCHSDCLCKYVEIFIL